MYQLVHTTNSRTSYYYILDTATGLRTMATRYIASLLSLDYPCDSRNNLVSTIWKDTILASSNNLSYFIPGNFPEFFI